METYSKETKTLEVIDQRKKRKHERENEYTGKQKQSNKGKRIQTGLNR